MAHMYFQDLQQIESFESVQDLLVLLHRPDKIEPSQHFSSSQSPKTLRGLFFLGFRTKKMRPLGALGLWKARKCGEVSGSGCRA